MHGRFQGFSGRVSGRRWNRLHTGLRRVRWSEHGLFGISDGWYGQLSGKEAEVRRRVGSEQGTAGTVRSAVREESGYGKMN